MGLTVAIIGRPNVGKSTLFNRLVGRRSALVDDRPGMTRDRREGQATLGDLSFTAVDTAGLEDMTDDSLEGRMRRQTERAVAEADVALMVIDARAGITPLDREFARALRRGKTPVILVANKCEGRVSNPGLYESFSLGLGDPIAVSAEHGLGLGDLSDALDAFAREAAGPDRADRAEEPAVVEASEPTGRTDFDGDMEEEPDEDEVRIIQLAIVGRPNVGKSTLVNALLDDDRVLTGPEPGVTRDAIAVDWSYKDQPFRLVDTAGLRRRARVTDRMEQISAADTLEAVRLAQIVVLVVEADAVLDKQDLTIARHVVDEGRALIVAVNKWDAASDRKATLGRLRDRLETSLTQVRGVPTVTLSALHRRGLDTLLDEVMAIYRIWNARVATGPLNRWLAAMVEAHPPPMVAGRRLKLRYITQIKSRPPTFALWTTRPAEVPESYMRYLVNGLRDSFGLTGVPLRLILRKGQNPYAKS
ncbi:MAG: ribosome biogenesis GTPase Der [Inquilinaceae bacterium]